MISNINRERERRQEKTRERNKSFIYFKTVKSDSPLLMISNINREREKREERGPYISYQIQLIQANKYN